MWFNGEENPESADMAIRILTKSHPLETMNLLAMQQSADATAADAFGQSFNQWTRADPEAASTWLRDQPPGEVRDTGIDQMIYILNASGPTNDFEAAIQWAASAGDKNRSQFMEQVLGQWRKADFDAAAAAGAKYRISVDRPDAAGSDESMDPFSK